jgi:hypothetical protein
VAQLFSLGSNAISKLNYNKNNKKGHDMADYVIRSWKAQDQPIEGADSFIKIEGRASGLLSWLLSLLKISPTVTLHVSADKITFEEGSLEGSVIYHTPLENTCSTFYGYTKPWKQALIVGVLVGLITFWLLCIPGIIAGLLYYYLKKTLTLGYTDKGGFKHAISFGRSVIEGQNIDESEAGRVCTIMQRLIDARRQKILP